jgi:hypothetical protein
MLAALPAKPEKNTLIAQSEDKKIALYKLDTGEFQVNCRKDADAKYDVTIFLAPYRDTHYYKKDWNIYDVLK